MAYGLPPTFAGSRKLQHMPVNHLHTFHIPVMGLSFTIDTPVKVARYGINSVVSIMEDELIERMRAHYCSAYHLPYTAIQRYDDDHRARRITSYLNLLKEITERQFRRLQQENFENGSDICRYFELLPESSSLYQSYLKMLCLEEGPEKSALQDELILEIKAGSIDVNIMAKADRPGYDREDRELPIEFSNALSSLRGYANSELCSSLIISAGYNPRLYAYLCNFKDFFPDSNGILRKKIVLKVSDYRSAQIQGTLLAKKGIWVSEFRIESGLNCGGHAFPTEGLLLGPILEEFKMKRDELQEAMYQHCCTAWEGLKITYKDFHPSTLLSVQGGIGTFEEDLFLKKFYKVDLSGWGSPFLLVPECTNVDEDTLHKLVNAQASDYYLSNASPLGVPFNNFRPASAEEERLTRIRKNRPGAPCYKNHLASNTEFTKVSICTASREYQYKKLKSIAAGTMNALEKETETQKLIEKECLCEGLSTSVLIKNNMGLSHKLKSVSICPGPNLAYFNRIASLEEMCGHIYGKSSLITRRRPHMFINELRLYIDYYRKQNTLVIKNKHEQKYLDTFRNNLLHGISYYKQLAAETGISIIADLENMIDELMNTKLPSAIEEEVLH